MPLRAVESFLVRSGTFDGAACRHLRERRVGRQIDLAILVGVNRATVCRWELGMRQPDGKSFVLICDALRVSDPDELLL